MEELFSLDNEEARDLKDSIGETVNTAIEHAMQSGMRHATVTVKLEVELQSVEQESGKVMLVPVYRYKAGIRIGGNYETGKGAVTSKMGMWRDRDGYWHTQYADQQLSMVE